MSYTGNQDALTNGAAEPPKLARVLDLLAEHETANGIKYTAAPVKKAREAAERAAALREALRARQAAAQQAALIPGREHATGAATADERDGLAMLLGRPGRAEERHQRQACVGAAG